MTFRPEHTFELFPGTLKIDPGRCFLNIKVHGKHDRLTCSVLPVAFESVTQPDNTAVRTPTLSIVAFRSKKWGTCTLFADSDYPMPSSRIGALIKLALNTPRGYLECVEPAGWSKIEITYPGHWAHPGKGFHMTVRRNDMYVHSRIEAIWTEGQDAHDEQRFAISLNTDELGNWVEKLFREHEAALGERYHVSMDPDIDCEAST